jgi:hypothetical protein
VEPVLPVSWVVGRRCPVPAADAARVLDRLVRHPAVLPMTGALVDDPALDASSWPWTPTWRGHARLAGRTARSAAAVEVLPWSHRTCEVQVRTTARRSPSSRWCDGAAALAADVAALVHAAWLARDVLAALDAPTGARPRGTR